LDDSGNGKILTLPYHMTPEDPLLLYKPPTLLTLVRFLKARKTTLTEVFCSFIRHFQASAPSGV